MAVTVADGAAGVFRHEYKYRVGVPQYIALRQRVRAVAKPDENTFGNGYYNITSLYFDNCDDKALREKLDGTSRREKFRLRYYNGDMTRIMLEKKQKYDGLCLKTQCAITKRQCGLLTTGDRWLPDGADPLLMELDFKMKTQLLRPRTTVSYKREPFVFSPGNVRITFDSEIRSGTPESFFEPSTVSVPVYPSGCIILEIKYDDFLPQIISDALQIGEIRQNAFSKYAACRLFE